MYKINKLLLLLALSLLSIADVYCVASAESKLIAAVNLFNLDYIKKVLADNPDLSADIEVDPEYYKNCPYLINRLIHACVSSGAIKNEDKCIEIADLLIKRGANINRHNKTAMLPLSQAIMANLNKLAKFLVSKGSIINQETERFPLRLAVSNDNFKMVKFLLDHGADVNASIFQNETVLDIASPQMKTFITNFNKFRIRSLKHYSIQRIKRDRQMFEESIETLPEELRVKVSRLY